MKPTAENKILKYNLLFLGTTVFLFGFLKFFEPFRTQFNVQITKSGLPRFSLPTGIAGEISIGLGLLSASCLKQKPTNLFNLIVSVASAGLIATMGGATYLPAFAPGGASKCAPSKNKASIHPFVLYVFGHSESFSTLSRQ